MGSHLKSHPEVSIVLVNTHLKWVKKLYIIKNVSETSSLPTKGYIFNFFIWPRPPVNTRSEEKKENNLNKENMTTRKHNRKALPKLQKYEKNGGNRILINFLKISDLTFLWPNKESGQNSDHSQKFLTNWQLCLWRFPRKNNRGFEILFWYLCRLWLQKSNLD